VVVRVRFVVVRVGHVFVCPIRCAATHDCRRSSVSGDVVWRSRRGCRSRGSRLGRVFRESRRVSRSLCSRCSRCRSRSARGRWHTA
jgi:hypothetical protein